MPPPASSRSVGPFGSPIRSTTAAVALNCPVWPDVSGQSALLSYEYSRAMKSGG